MAEVADMIKLMEQLVASKAEKKEDVAPIDEDKAEAARRTSASLDGGDFLYTARRLAYRAARFHVDPPAILGAGSLESRTYAKMVDAGDWAGADKTYLDWLKAHDPVLYLKTLNLEGLAREFNQNHRRMVSESPSFVRWMDMEELASYLDGTFESRTEEDGGRRGYKALSLSS